MSNTGIASACNNEEMYVEKSSVKSKRNCCVFCMKLQSQLARHFVTVHCDQPEVKLFSSLPKRHEERRKLIENLRKQGNFKFNTCVKINTGHLIVTRRPAANSRNTATDFVACSKCKGFFAKSAIRHHILKCGKAKKHISRFHHLANETFKSVFLVMRNDDVTRVLRYDDLLIIYGNKLCIKYKAQHQHDMMRARLRLLGRFLLTIKDINNAIQGFESIYNPNVYDNCIDAINKVAGYDHVNKMYKTPAVASTLSTTIKQVANIWIAECIKNGNAEKKNLAKDFLKVLVADIGTSINKTVTETQSAKKRRKTVTLPLLEDIKALYTHLKTKRTEAYTRLKSSFSYEAWLSLSKVTLTSVHVFKRRRAGEIERTLIEDFETYEKINERMSDMYRTLSLQDKKIAEKYVRFCIRGKLGRTVPVLLSTELLQCIKVILKYRKEAGVPSRNPYVFGLHGMDKNRYKYLRACVLMRKFARECNATSSATLRGTILRKHIATYCIQLNLNDFEISELATFMSHADKIHQQYYRQQPASRDILKISRYLEAVQGTEHESSNDTSDDENEHYEDTSDKNTENDTAKG